MLPPVLLVTALLLGPACCGPPPAGTSPHQQTAAPTAGTAGASTPTDETRVEVTLDQVAAELSRLYRAKDRAAALEPLAELAKTLAGVQAIVAAVSGRLDLIYDSQIKQQKTLVDLARRTDTMEEWQSETSSRLDNLQDQQQKARADLTRRLDEWQAETSSRLDAVQSTLSTVQETQSELSHALPTRFDAVEASQDSLSSRVDTLLQQQRTAGTATSGPAGLQQQLDAIQIAVSLIPKIVLGKKCLSDADCSSTLPEAECGGDGLCSCRVGYRQVLDTECRKFSRLSEACVESAECQTLVPNSACTGGVCSCVSGFWNHNNEECRRILAVNKDGSCVGDQDCAPGLHLRCVSGMCACDIKMVGNYEYRLTGGSDCSEGNVELREIDDFWGLVCDDDWDSSDAEVICRSLGFTSGSPTVKSVFGRSTNFHMDDVRCRGSEAHLMSCRFRGWRNHNCAAGEVAGVRCS